jgi:hypothetical protein
LVLLALAIPHLLLAPDGPPYMLRPEDFLLRSTKYFQARNPAQHLPEASAQGQMAGLWMQSTQKAQARLDFL